LGNKKDSLTLSYYIKSNSPTHTFLHLSEKEEKEDETKKQQNQIILDEKVFYYFKYYIE